MRGVIIPHMAALTPTEKASLAERTRKLTDDPALLERICGHIANGGGLIDLCKQWDVRYSDVVLWIFADKGRKMLYDSAMSACNAWFVQRIFAELKTMATVDIRDAFDENGRLRDIASMPEELARCISSVEVFEEFSGRGLDKELTGHTKKIRFWDKLKSLELLGKNLNMFIERRELRVSVTLEEMLGGSMDKPEVKQVVDQAVKTIEVKAEPETPLHEPTIPEGDSE